VKWRRRSGNSSDVIDVRGRRGGARPGVAVPGGLGLVGVLVFLAVQLLGGGSAFSVPPGFEDGTTAPPSEDIPPSQDPDRDLAEFSEYVFLDAQETWEKTFAEQGRPYRRAKLVLYRAAVTTGCGSASSAVGPFYCPGDGRVYLDLSFYRDMEQQLGAGGDFAWAYVIAHEVGHHVQRELGTSDDVRNLQRESPDQANPLSVRLELQADCYAGVWARTVYDQLEAGDLEEAIQASEAVGDDRLQNRARGSVDPDSFTHGTSEQRARWFNAGRESGEPAACDTFSPDDV
jgi:predicted metalloprotease